MITKKLQPSLYDELIIDNFAGGGGASSGIEMALVKANVSIQQARYAA